MSTDPYAVTPQEILEYENCCRHHMRQLMRYLPDTLWHYTTGATFAQIMEYQTIWATQISCLNDHMEFRHGV